MSYYHHTLLKTVAYLQIYQRYLFEMTTIAFNPEPAINIFDFLHPSHVSAFFFPRRWRVIRDGTKQGKQYGDIAS